MKVENLLIDEINKSSLNPHIQNIKVNDRENYNFLYGNFFIDGFLFLPIEHKTLATSLDLFSFSHPIKYNKYFTNNYFDVLKNQANNVKILKKCFVVGNDTNYYHNLILYLPKIISLISNKKIISKVDYILFNKYLPTKFIEFIQEILKIKKINKEIILIDQKLYLLQESYCPAILGRDFKIEKNIIFWEKIYKKILVRNQIPQINYEKIYISRQDSSHRKIINEKELIIFLKKMGFKIILLSKMDIFSQMNLFNKAKIIVGYHGAGLANLVFSSSHAKVIELYPKAKQKIRINIKIISKIKNLEHIFFFIDYKNNKNKLKNLTYYDGIVDMVNFKKLINKIL